MCISTDDHQPLSFGEHILHYFACIEICNRVGYFSPQHPAWQYEAGVERKKLERRSHSQTDSGIDADLEAEIQRRIDSKIAELATEVLRRYRRIDAIRAAIQQERTNYGPTPIPTTDKDLVACVTESHELWKSSAEFRDNIDAVRTWRQQRRLVPSGGGDDEIAALRSWASANEESQSPQYAIDEDVQAYVTQFEKPSGDGEEPDSPLQSVHDSPPGLALTRDFTYQRCSVANLLREGQQFRGDNHSDRIRYIHVPYNNLKWVEDALNPYAGENTRRFLPMDQWTAAASRGSPAPRRRQAQCEQQSVHDRHFPTTCRFIPSERDGSAVGIAVIMPYLHWETDRNREAFSRIIGTEMARHKVRMKEMAEQDHKQRQALRSGLPLPSRVRIPHLPGEGVLHWGPAPPLLMPTWSNILDEVYHFSPSADSRVKLETTGRLTTPSALGQFLLDAARLYSVMATFRDRKMMEAYLFNEPPFHPRRTLDQSYSWAMKTTRDRDRDQVVFRATNYKPENRHRLRREYTVSRRPWKTESDSEPKWFWDGHADFENSSGCTTCRDASRQTPKVVMVDQLWMCVLDRSTLLTLFPRRYGTDELDDPSGVDSAIRRVLGIRADLRSVFDLALIVLEESSMSLLNRGGTGDGKPNVLRIFREAIGSLAHCEMRERNRTWRINANIQALKKWGADMAEIAALLLDSTPEGRLQLEVKDIIEELDMMIHITKSQVAVIQEFPIHVAEFFDPDGQHESPYPRATHNHPAPGPGLPGGVEAWSQFKKSHSGVLRRVQAGLEELETLQATARNTSQTIDGLVALKQQQIAILQTWQSAEQGQEAVKQGKALPIFTMFTIIFLPLSFMTSIFGMNAQEFEDGAWTVAEELRIIIPVAVAVMFATLQLTYFDFVRELLMSGLAYTFTYVSIRTGLYALWLEIAHFFNTESIKSERMAAMAEMKKEARAFQRRQRARRRAEEHARKVEPVEV